MLADIEMALPRVCDFPPDAWFAVHGAFAACFSAILGREIQEDYE